MAGMLPATIVCGVKISILPLDNDTLPIPLTGSYAQASSNGKKILV